jgi:hypothetical protein
MSHKLADADVGVVVDDWAGGTVMAKSLPIPIGPLGSARPSFGPPPYRKNASVTDKSVEVPLDKVSTAAMRRASYRERDRKRAIDPGALDFDFEDDAEAEEESLAANDAEVGGKSMQRALNILQKHSEIPPAGTRTLSPSLMATTDKLCWIGMWRSLA